MKKRKMIIIASVIAVLGVGLIFFIWHDNSGDSKTSNESSQTTISQESDMNSTTNTSQSNSDSSTSDQNESSNSGSQSAQTNSTSSTTKDSQKNNGTNSSSQASQQNQLPTNVINMLAYVKTYGGPGNVSGQDLIIDGNVIGQGTDDSTGTVAISGNNVSLTIEGKTNTYNINDLAKEYYNTSDQQQKINNLINQGVNQGNKYH